MTSTLTLHSAKARGEEPDPARQFRRDPFDKGELIASDSEEGPVKPKRKRRGGPLPDRFDEMLAPYYDRLDQVKETALYPARILGQRLDFVLDGMQQAGVLWQQLVAQAVTDLFRPKRQPLAQAGGAPGGPAVKPVSFCDIYTFNVQFTDNADVPLYNFDGQTKARYAASPLVVDPIASEKAIAAIRECAERAQGIPPATEGRYAGIPLAHVLFHVGEEDLQGFLRYVKAYPGNYVGRNLKISETFATWIVYGAPAP